MSREKVPRVNLYRCYCPSQRKYCQKPPGVFQKRGGQGLYRLEKHQNECAACCVEDHLRVTGESLHSKGKPADTDVSGISTSREPQYRPEYQGKPCPADHLAAVPCIKKRVCPGSRGIRHRTHKGSPSAYPQFLQQKPREETGQEHVHGEEEPDCGFRAEEQHWQTSERIEYRSAEGFIEWDSAENVGIPQGKLPVG